MYEGYCVPSFSYSCNENGVLLRAETMAIQSSYMLPCHVIGQSAQIDGKKRRVVHDGLSL